MIINDTFIDEMTKFGSKNVEINPLLSNHNFVPFLLEPMKHKSLKAVLLKKMDRELLK